MKTRRLKHFRLRAQGGDNSSGDKVKLGNQTLTKDFGIVMHAGCLFPNEQSNCELDPEKDEVIYQFSDWIGSYSASELAKTQWDDPDIGIVLKWKWQSDERPSRDIVAAESPAVRSLWLH